MSNEMTVETLLQAFPEPLTESDAISMLASLAAEELMEVKESLDLASLYSRIDELDADLIDKLAVDFKIDWYDPNATLEQKRNQLASCFYVHNKLGTVGAVRKALNDLFPGSYLIDKPNLIYLPNRPYLYAVMLEAQWMFDDTTLQRLQSWLLIYANIRSVLYAVYAHTALQVGLSTGIPACQFGRVVATVAGYDPSAGEILVDELDVILANEIGEILLA